jgi:hypothetical protein
MLASFGRRRMIAGSLAPADGTILAGKNPVQGGQAGESDHSDRSPAPLGFAKPKIRAHGMTNSWNHVVPAIMMPPKWR